ncbi:MAG: sodium:solute symporter [Bacteroidota bacterium]|nr:sodium:solute symporter [Bacteroidota bacterium]
MSPALIFLSFSFYTILLFVVSWITARRSSNASFFIGDRISPWFVVAYGMIGASLSGVTFISIPGDVGSTNFSYMIIVIGYLFGYIIIANVLLPLYYKLQLTSIYSYLEQRFGFWSYKTGAFFFLISRVIGASFRMFLVVNVLQLFVFDAWGIPFWLTVTCFIILIMLYTFRGGIKTIVWTDMLQTTFMLLSVVITILVIAFSINVSLSELLGMVRESTYSQLTFFEWQHKHFVLKDFLAGVFIAIVMTGLDQDMMQKNLSCRNLKDARKNMYWLATALVPVNLLFLFLGAVLFIFAGKMGIAIPELSDDLFPTIALNHLGAFAGVVFIIGLIAAAYSSADSALTALTTSFSIDMLGLQKRDDISEKQRIRIRYFVHIGVSATVLAVIILFRAINDQSVISKLFTIAGYTYGPLLGIYAFGLLTHLKLKDKYVPLVAIVSPVICYLLSIYDERIFNGYNFGFELLIMNCLITFIGLFVIAYPLLLLQLI